jgi:hypothetical protein
VFLSERIEPTTLVPTIDSGTTRLSRGLEFPYKGSIGIKESFRRFLALKRSLTPFLQYI